MATIQIISGTYGYNHDGIISPVSRGGTCEVPRTEAARLAALGVAAIIGDDASEAVATHSVTADAGTQSSDIGAAECGAEGPEESYFLDPEQLEGMTVAELKAMAEDFDLKTAKRWTKADYIRALTSIDVGVDTDSDGAIEEPPALSAEAPIV